MENCPSVELCYERVLQYLYCINNVAIVVVRLTSENVSIRLTLRLNFLQFDTNLKSKCLFLSTIKAQNQIISNKFKIY